MSIPKKKPFKIFYSWQSDLPDQVNAQLIRSVLGAVVSELTEDGDVQVKAVLDEATRDEPGSPNIVDTIFEKILKSDVFVCDLSKVHETTAPDGEVRKFCNPNVAIELGFAVRELGWKRIILLFNEGYGKLPHDLPFDTHANRATKYKCIAEFNGNKLTSKSVSHISNAKGLLKKQLVSALKLVVTSNPKRPRELERKTAEEIHRERDVEQLKRVFGWIHLNTLDEFIKRLGYSKVTRKGMFLYYGLKESVSSSSFHIYDAKLLAFLKALVSKWAACLRYTEAMDGEMNQKELYFHLPGDMFQSSEQENFFNLTWKSAYPLRKALDKLLSYVRSNYLEIDLKTSGEIAMRHYLDT